MGPLWFMRQGRRFGVHFLGEDGWIASILVFASEDAG